MSEDSQINRFSGAYIHSLICVWSKWVSFQIVVHHWKCWTKKWILIFIYRGKFSEHNDNRLDGNAWILIQLCTVCFQCFNFFFCSIRWFLLFYIPLCVGQYRNRSDVNVNTMVHIIIRIERTGIPSRRELFEFRTNEQSKWPINIFIVANFSPFLLNVYMNYYFLFRCPMSRCVRFNV